MCTDYNVLTFITNKNIKNRKRGIFWEHNNLLAMHCTLTDFSLQSDICITLKF